jgi:hypothetical protein
MSSNQPYVYLARAGTRADISLNLKHFKNPFQSVKLLITMRVSCIFPSRRDIELIGSHYQTHGPLHHAPERQEWSIQDESGLCH